MISVLKWKETFVRFPNCIYMYFLTVLYMYQLLCLFTEPQKWVRLKGTTVGHLVPPLCSSRVILEHMALDCAQTVLEYLQGGRLHNFSEQFVPFYGHQHNNFFYYYYLIMALAVGTVVMVGFVGFIFPF